MKKKQKRFIDKKASYKSKQRQLWLSILWFLATILATGLAGIFLFQKNITYGLVLLLIVYGLDPARAEFIRALLIAGGAALIGTTLLRRKGAALVGGLIVLWVGFLQTFIQIQLQPVIDPGGIVEPLNSMMLVRNVLLIWSLGVTSAFIGTAIGATTGEVLVEPFYLFVAQVWRHWFHPYLFPEDTLPQITTKHIRLPAPHRKSLGRWLAAAGLLAALILSANARDLFIIAPDTGIHTPPVFYDQYGNAINGTLVSDSLISTALNHELRPFLVYLPPSYNTPAGKNKRYPVLYLLHGSPGKAVDWITGGKASESADELIAMHKIPELIMVFPDGNGELEGSSEWGNSYNQRQQMETFVVSELVKYVDRHYRTIADTLHRGIGGLSMGGFGATNIAIHHPDIFGNLISLGGYYNAEGSIWGTNTIYRQINSPISTILYSRQAWKLQMYLGAATLDEPYYTDTLQFVKVIQQFHIYYQLDIEKGYHTWRVWQEQMYNALAWLTWHPHKIPRMPR